MIRKKKWNNTSKYTHVDNKRSAKMCERPPKHFHPLLQKEKELQETLHRILPEGIANSLSPKSSRLVHLHGLPKAGDTPGDFIHRSPRSAYKIADIWHVRYRRSNSPEFAKSVRPCDFLPFHCESPVKLTNQMGRYIITWLSKWWKAPKIVSEQKKRNQFDHTMVRKAMLIWCNVERLQSSSQEGLCVNKSISSTIIFYCPAFQKTSCSVFVAKLWQQPTLFLASLSPFCVSTLVRTIFKRHPMEPGIKA